MVMPPIKIWDYTNNAFKLASGYQYADKTVGPISFTTEGVLTSLASFALKFTTSGYVLTNNGLIGATAAGSTGILAVSQPTDTGLTKITIGASGEVFGDNAGIGVFGLVTIANAGTITGNTYGIFDPYIGNVTITNSGTINGGTYAISVTGAGTHTITNSGILNGHITAGGVGIDLLTNSGTINGPVDLGDGNNVLKNTGFINGNVLFGTGNDKFTDSGSIFPGAGIDMGAGDDVFTGGNSTEFVLDGAGKDKYALGGGYDVFLAGAPGSADGFVDTIDGGSSSGVNPTGAIHGQGDTYSAVFAVNAVVINIDTVSHSEPSASQLVYVASQASGTDIGIDSIKNFESAYGGNGADIIFGNAVSNDLEGNNGHDVLHGYAGNDYVEGGAGSDFLFGDKGADLLMGGTVITPADHAADYFMYTALTDSTVAKAGRDTITFFEDGFDQIVLQAIPGHTNGTFVGVDAAFAPLAGHLAARAVTTLAGWTIQIDTNGDGKADMAIDVVDVAHTVSWSGADFLF